MTHPRRHVSRLLPLYIALVLAVVSSARAAGGQHPDAGPVCGNELRQLEAKEQSLQICLRQRAEVERGVADCSEDLAKAQRQTRNTAALLESTKDERDALCTASGALVASVLDARTPLPDLGSCTSEAAANGLEQLIHSWNESKLALSQFAGWSSGESDSLPRAPALGVGASPVVRRILGGGRIDPPLPYRRLLIEAVRLVAPKHLRRLRAAGSATLDAWFTSSAELEAAFLTEAQAVLAARGTGLGPRQAAALRFVQSFQDLVGCETHAWLRECPRARRLQAFLESSAPLIVRQRLQEIWVQPCAEVRSKVVLSWLRELPSSQVSTGEADWDQIIQTAYDKLVSCYLATNGHEQKFAGWFAERLPQAHVLTTTGLHDVDALRAKWVSTSAEAACLETVNALRTLQTPTRCALPEMVAEPLRRWFGRASTAAAGADGTVAQACAHYVRALWDGNEARVLGSYPGPPTAAALVRVDRETAFRPIKSLRVLCDTRVGAPQEFVNDMRRVGAVARAAGEDLTEMPWRLSNEAEAPEEAARYQQASSIVSWVARRVRGEEPCDALGLGAQTCKACEQDGQNSRYDCGLLASLTARWSRFNNITFGLGGLLLALIVLLVWSLRLARAWAAYGPWRRELRGHLESMGLPVAPDARRLLWPSRMGTLLVNLPPGPAWERWGTAAVITRAEKGAAVSSRDVTRAALSARSQGAELAMLCHQEGAAPDLSAVRAILDWAARGPHKAMQILPISVERLRWIRTPEDLLDLIEQTSLRGNPFEVRGRLVSSSQFFNRERLVSGLISACEAGHWTIVTGLRRFGKSSLALEVARRLQGAYAYVDLAGFHHEVSSSSDASRVADGILRYVCEQFHGSAQKVHQATDLPPVPQTGDSLDAGALSVWMRDMVSACRKASGGRPVTLLLILDEVEQAIGVGPQRIANALDVVSVLVGRLRAVLNNAQLSQGGDKVGVLFCSALHPLLWAPLSTLSNQSLLGAFPSVFVPRLPQEAAQAMMRGLGARQGVRFTDAALDLIIREAQGIPILVRRMGSAVLELYDPERARQGSLGAVEIGIEGASAAVRREEEDGAPLRVWVESEIGDAHNPAGVLLRALAVAGRMPVEDLRRTAAQVTKEQFVDSGIAALLSPEETARRAAEAAGYIVRMLGEIGILVPEGDETQPEAYSFPESLVRRILATPRRDSLMGF
ncbi:MAG: hypothetical protein SF187_30385 [Deltaproteobacteria bacterium]|nr:hypothetical protein [Deltaproteobacteria bacterium]